MLGILNEVKMMRQEGKIHKKLIVALRLMSFAALIIGGIEVYQIVFKGETAWIAIVLAMAGLLAGWYLFAPLNAAEWDEEKEVVAARRMDWIGFTAIGAYVAFIITLRMFLNQTLPAQTTILALAFVFGMLIGRICGTIFKIHRAYKTVHASNTSA